MKNDGNPILLQERACIETTYPKETTNMWADRARQNWQIYTIPQRKVERTMVGKVTWITLDVGF